MPFSYISILLFYSCFRFNQIYPHLCDNFSTPNLFHIHRFKQHRFMQKVHRQQLIHQFVNTLRFSLHFFLPYLHKILYTRNVCFHISEKYELLHRNTHLRRYCSKMLSSIIIANFVMVLNPP